MGHLLLGRIHQRVWCRFWLEFGGREDTLLQRQAIGLWGLSCAGLWWYHTARLFHKPSPGRRRDQPPVVSVQRHLGHISRDSLGGPQCCNASWSHTGFCQVYQTFQGTRWIGCWSCALGPCTGSWSARLVCNYLGQHGPCWVWGWGSQWLLSTGSGSLLWFRCYSGYLWGFSTCPQGDVSIDCCGSHQVQGHGVWPSRWNAWDPSTWRVCCRPPYCQKWSRFGPSHPVPWLPGILHCSGQRRSYLMNI